MAKGNLWSRMQVSYPMISLKSALAFKNENPNAKTEPLDVSLPIKRPH